MRIQTLGILLAIPFLYSAASYSEDTTPHQGGQTAAKPETASATASSSPTPSTTTGTAEEKPADASSGPQSEEQLAEAVSKNTEKAENFDTEMEGTIDEIDDYESTDLKKFDGLSTVKQESLIQGLMDHAQGKDTVWGKKIGEHLGKDTGTPGNVPPENTIRHLGKIASTSPKTVEKFKGLLEKGEAGERILAAKVLGQMKNEQAPLLSQRLEQEKDPEVKQALLGSLRADGKQPIDKEVLSRVSSIALDKASPEKIRLEAIRALGRLTPDGYREVASAMGSAMTVTQTVLNPDRRHVAPALTSLVKDNSQSVELHAAAFELLAHSDPTSIPAISHVGANLDKPGNQPLTSNFLSAITSSLREKPDSRIAGTILAKALPKLSEDEQYRATRILSDEGSKVAHLSHATGGNLIRQGLAQNDAKLASYGLDIISAGTTSSFTRENYARVVDAVLKADSKFDEHTKLSLLSKAAAKVGRDGWNEDLHNRLAEMLGKSAAPGATYRSWALELNESVRESLGEHKKEGLSGTMTSGKKAYDAKFEAQLEYARAKMLTPEKALGQLIGNQPKWNRIDFLNANELGGGNNYAWRTANAALGALFIAKSARYNATAQAELDRVVKEVLVTPEASTAPNAGSQKQADAASFLVNSLKASGITGEKLEKLSSQVNSVLKDRSGEGLSSAEELYTKQFLSLFLKEVKDNYPLDAKQRQVVESALTRSQQGLTRDLTVAGKKGRDENQFNSLMNTYGFSTSVLAATAVPPEAKTLLQAVADRSKNPLTTTYQPAFDTFTMTERGSASRNVTFHLARYQTDTEPALRSQHRENLVKSLENYVTHAPALLAHVNRNNTHLGNEGLAPYYFYGSIPYATAALNVIAMDPAATPGQKARVEMLRQGFSSIIAHAVGDGLALPQGEERYPSSPVYANPLLGLSILPLLNTKELGVLRSGGE